MSLERSWEQYLLNEEIERDIFMYIQSLQEIVTRLKPKSMAEKRRLGLAIQHLKEVRKYARRMQNKVDLLEEKLNILEEALNENEEK
jgi:hypothetical protein|tara:strand:- start:68 stop:328 length:261 start_codon:yes stop_codon:yes gene_type:complete